MLKKHIFIILLALCNQLLGQDYKLVLTSLEKKTILNNVTLLKNSKEIEPYLRQCKIAQLNSDKIDSLLLAKEIYLFLNKRLELNAKEMDSLFLFSRNLGNEKRENFNNYRKTIAQILTKEEYSNLYKKIIDHRAALATQNEINELKKKYELNNTTETSLRNFISPLKKESSLLELYFAYNKKLASLKKIEFDAISKKSIKDQIKTLNLAPKLNILNSTDPPIASFVKKAQSLGIENILIENIAKKMLSFKRLLKQAQSVSGLTNENQLYIIDDESYHSSKVIKNFESYLAAQLTQKQYKALFWDQLKPKIEIATINRLEELKNDYSETINSLKEKKIDVLKKWVEKYVTNEIVAQRYYSYAPPLAKTKVKTIKMEANKKYNEILCKLTNESISYKNSDLRIKKFLQNAKNKGVEVKKANTILLLCLAYEQEQEELMNSKKYDKKHIYNLETSYNNKNKKRDAFRYSLTKKLSQEEFKKLFWEQLKPEINNKIKSRVQKIQQVYNLKGNNYSIIRDLVSEQVSKEVVAEQYFSYDKKKAKQKVKALKYKFDNEYKEKIKEFSQ